MNPLAAALFVSLLAATGEVAVLPLDAPGIAREREVTVLYSVFTRDPNPERVARGALFGIVNRRYPGAPAGWLAPFFERTEAIVLGLKREAGTFSVEFLAGFGRGLGPADRDNLDRPSGILVVGARGDPAAPLARKAAATLAHAVACEVSGTLFDVTTLECFGAEPFRLARLGDRGPAARRETLVHLSREGSAIRLRTRGLRKFGRPDATLEGLAPADVDPGTHLLRAVAVRLSEGDLRPDGRGLEIAGADLAAMLEPGSTTVSPIRPDATCEVRLAATRRQAFDDLNRLVRVIGGDGSSTSAVEAVKRLFDLPAAAARPLTGEELEAATAEGRRTLADAAAAFPYPAGDEFYALVNPDLPAESGSLLWIRVLQVLPTGELIGSVQPGQFTRAVSAGDHLTVPLRRAYDWVLLREGRAVAGDYLRRNLETKRK